MCLAAVLIVLWHFLGHVPTQRGIPLIQHPTPTPPKTLHNGQQSNTQSKVTQTLLTQKETSPLLSLTIAPHRARRHTHMNTWQVTPRHTNTGTGPGHRTATWWNIAGGVAGRHKGRHTNIPWDILVLNNGMNTNATGLGRESLGNKVMALTVEYSFLLNRFQLRLEKCFYSVGVSVNKVWLYLLLSRYLSEFDSNIYHDMTNHV